MSDVDRSAGEIDNAELDDDDLDDDEEFEDDDEIELSAAAAADEDDDDEDDDDEVGGPGNRIVGGLPKSVLEYVARSIVDDPDGVHVETADRRGDIELRLHVSPGDMGKVIGRRGRVAQALRQVVAAAGIKEGVRASLDIVD